LSPDAQKTLKRVIWLFFPLLEREITIANPQNAFEYQRVVAHSTNFKCLNFVFLKPISEDIRQMEQNNANSQLTKQIADLTNIDRLIGNTLNLLSDIEIKGAYASPVAEIQTWLTGFKSTIQAQKQALEAALPKPDAVEAKPVDLAEVKG
jgi:hypothetical protein